MLHQDHLPQKGLHGRQRAAVIGSKFQGIEGPGIGQLTGVELDTCLGKQRLQCFLGLGLLLLALAGQRNQQHQQHDIGHQKNQNHNVLDLGYGHGAPP